MAERLDQLNTRAARDRGTRPRRRPGTGRERGVDAPLVWAAGEGWHPGVVGIVASRLKEATNRPAVVIGLAGDEGKGSGPVGQRRRSGRVDSAPGRRRSADQRWRAQDGRRADRGT